MLKITYSARGFCGLFMVAGLTFATTALDSVAASKARMIQDKAKSALTDKEAAKNKWTQFDRLAVKYPLLVTAAKGAHRRMANFCAAYGYMPADRIVRANPSTQSREKLEEYRKQRIACDRLDDLKNNVGMVLKKIEDDKLKVRAEIDKLDAMKGAATDIIPWSTDMEKKLADANTKLKELEDEYLLLCALRDEASTL